ncbi:lactonase family protein [Actinospica durhamensis]|uniref:Lactonase family protein n=1 Tax=Actinospica durhamensis TaxID=1508375 RepID=A0A941ETN3_9ACTN|nr:lactonase family protein [Actinospica durhamensis]MBR7837023.1 lactonase family protein [Actinospica durhamensis]
MQGFELTIGSYTGGPNPIRGIVRAGLSADGATVAARGEVTPFADPSWLVRGGVDGELLYAVDEGPTGRVAAFVDRGQDWFEPHGAAMPTGGSEPCYAALVGGGAFLAVANYGDADDRGSVSLHRIEPDGSVGGQTHLASLEGSGPEADRQAGPHAHMVRESPDGRFVLAVDLGTDSIHTFTLEAGQGTLMQVARSSFRPGFGPRHLVFHPAGTYAYVVGELGFSLAVCTYAAAGGEFAVLGEVPLLEDGVPGSDFPSAVQIASDGRFLYTANRGRDTLLTFSLADPAKPQLVSTVPIGGAWPRDIVLSPDGTLLLSANQRSDSISVFRLDPATGVPEQTGASLKVFAPACVLMRAED